MSGPRERALGSDDEGERPSRRPFRPRYASDLQLHLGPCQIKRFSCNFGSVDSRKYGELSNPYADSIRSDSAHDTFLWQSRRYDSRTTIFSPEGEPCPVHLISYVTYSQSSSYLRRSSLPECVYHSSRSAASRDAETVPSFVYSVEYAMEAISMAGTVLAILSKEGVVMVAEKVRTSGIDIYTDFI
jgi:hypothetical protein